MRILLTGSSGWLGRYLAPRLRALGHTLTGLAGFTEVSEETLPESFPRMKVDTKFYRRSLAQPE